MNAGNNAQAAPAARAGETNEAVSPGDRVFFKIAAYSTAFAFSVVAGTIQAVRLGAAGFTLHLSFGTLAAAAVGAIVGLVYWKILLLDSTPRNRLLRRLASLFVLMGGVGAFLYPLRFISGEKLVEIIEGLTAAIAVVSTMGSVLWRMKRFFDSDEAGAEESR